MDQNVIQKIKEYLSNNNIKVLTDYTVNNRDYLITDFMIVNYSNEDKIIDLSFNVATRADIAAHFTLMLNELEDVNGISIMEIYMIDENGKYISGSECIKKHQENMRKLVIDDFVSEEVQLHYLKTHQLGSEC